MKFKQEFDFSLKSIYIAFVIWLFISISFYLFLNTLFKTTIVVWFLEYEIAYSFSYWIIYSQNFFIAFLSLMVGQYFAKLYFFIKNFKHKHRFTNDDFIIWYYLFWFFKISLMFLVGLFIDLLIIDEKYNIVEELYIIGILSILFLFFYSYNSFVKFFKNAQKTVYLLFIFYLFTASLISFINPVSVNTFQKNIIENNPINKYKIDLIKLPFKNKSADHSNAFYISKKNENQIVVIYQNEEYELNELNLLFKSHYQDSDYLFKYLTPVLLISSDFSMMDYKKLMTNLNAADFKKLNLGGKTNSNKFFDYISINNNHYDYIKDKNSPAPPPSPFFEESKNYTMKIKLLNEKYVCIDDKKIAVNLFNDYIITHLKTTDNPYFQIEINEKINYGTYLLTLSYLKQAHHDFVMSKLPKDSFFKDNSETILKYPLRYREKFNF